VKLVGEPQLLGEVNTERGSVMLELALPDSPDVVWAALTEPSRLACWLGSAEGSPARGAEFAIWHDETTRSTHTVTRWQPGWLLAMTWGFPDEGTSAVSFALSARGDHTVVTLEHDGLTEPASYAARWHRHLDYLAAHLDGSDKPFDEFWSGYDALVARYAATGHSAE
jgi:uncharacterized protein YndB with AHSA1/START domain